MLQRGEDIIIGVGIEATRGTAVAPQAWIPGRTPTGVMPVLEKTQLRETRASKIGSYGAEITQKRAEGDLEFNLRTETIGYLLLSLLGDVASEVKGGETVVYNHTFTVLENDPEHPSLSLGISQPANQDYNYPLAVVSGVSIEVVPDDLVVGKVNFIASAENEEGSPFTPSFASSDVYFRQQDVSIKIADNVAGLGAATAMKVKSLKLDLPNGARVDQNVSELNPGNVLATVLDMKGSFERDLQDADIHDLFVDGSYQAMQITMERADVTIGGTSKPKMVITFPRVSLEKWSPDRPIDDVVREQVDFIVHYDPSAAKAVDIVLTNLVEEYAAAIES